VKAVLLDLYDTLVWTDWSTLAQRLAARLDVDGPTLLRAFELTSVGRGTGRYGSVRGDLAAVVTAAGRSHDDAFIAALESELLSFLTQGVHVYDDVRPVLRLLRASGTPVAIVSNCDHATRPLLDNLGLERDVDAMVLSFEVGSLKPDALIFEQALAQLGVSAQDAVFVDDQARFLDGARALGIRTLRVARGPFYPAPTEGDAHPVITDLTGFGDPRAIERLLASQEPASLGQRR
jgi:HAD superfamily hydrolase (TIGR01509 family)